MELQWNDLQRLNSEIVKTVAKNTDEMTSV